MKSRQRPRITSKMGIEICSNTISKVCCQRWRHRFKPQLARQSTASEASGRPKPHWTANLTQAWNQLIMIHLEHKVKRAPYLHKLSQGASWDITTYRETKNWQYTWNKLELKSHNKQMKIISKTLTILILIEHQNGLTKEAESKCNLLITNIIQIQFKTTVSISRMPMPIKLIIHIGQDKSPPIRKLLMYKLLSNIQKRLSHTIWSCSCEARALSRQQLKYEDMPPSIV